jgi:magnesium transporter
MDKNEEMSKKLLNDVINLIDNNKILEVTELLEEYHQKDIAELIEILDENRQLKLFEILPINLAATILDEADSQLFDFILSKISLEHKKSILELMSLDDMADILGDLEEERREEIIDLLNHEDAKDLKELLVYKEDSAGGIMTTNVMAVRKDMTVGEAIDYMRENAPSAETIYYIYVVDQQDKLVGVLSLRELITSRPSNVLENIMSENIISVYVDDDQEEVVKLVSKYDLLAIPVTDSNGKLKGIITVDDVIDVMEEEATEDMYKFAGTSEYESENTEEDKPSVQILGSVKARLPWLIVTLFGGFLGTMVFSKLDIILNQNYIALVFFIPLILGMGGNIGTQASALTVRALSSKDGQIRNILIEGAIGALTGIACSLIIFITTYIWIKSLSISLIVSLALIVNMIVGAIIGALVPIIFKKLDVDPSIVSAPLISTTLDITGVTVYFIVVNTLLSKIA